ncbi:glycosyltransferase [Agromyces protaetiae]
MMLSSVGAAVRAGVPTVVLMHSLASFFLRGWRTGPIGLIAGARGSRPLAVWRAADAMLIATERDLDGFEHGLPLEHAEWTGTTEQGAAPAPRDPALPPLVLVSLSSMWMPGQADVYRRILTALAELPVRAIVTTGGAEIEGVLDAPPNVEIRVRSPHEEILPHASLVIGHGGHSTTFKALAHGVPVVVLPMHPLIDQPIVGRAVERAGLGRMLPKKASPAAIRSAVSDVLQDGRVAAEASGMGERLRERDGAAAAADRIERVLTTRAAVRAGAASE